MKQQIQAEILYRHDLGAGHYRIGLGCPEELTPVKPGQFVMLQVAPGDEPLLKRPFSIHRLTRGAFPTILEILYKTVGRGTRLLGRLSVGMKTELIGPLGRGFKVADGLQRIYIAAGGIGVAPMLFLVEDLLARGYGPDQLQIFLGARSRKELLCVDDFHDLGLRVHLTTDDGTAGDQCLITDPLAEAAGRTPPDLVLACGPNPMLACVIGIVETHHLPCQISVEAHMACGVGACLGCAVPTVDQSPPYVHVCRNGPVFPAGRIRLS